MANENLENFWSLKVEDVIRILKTSESGLTSKEAQSRLRIYGPNALKAKKQLNAYKLFLSQFKSPIILLLIIATLLSLFLGDWVDAVIIFSIILISGVLGFWQEYSASNAINKLLSIVQIKAEVLRDGVKIEIPVEEIVPGDIVILNAGDIVPADGIVIESKDLFVNEAVLTGETFPVEKEKGVSPEEAPINQRKNALWMGTSVVSGTGKELVVRTGKNTEFGKISEHLQFRAPETEFERGVRHFGYFLMEVTLILVIIIFFVNVVLKKPILDSFLFSLALAVGLTPQLLPAIISVNLSHGARRMAQLKTIVKRLSSLENFGSMNILCSDKTGTLTQGVVSLQSALDLSEEFNEKVLLYAYLNSYFETGYSNPIDEAIRRGHKYDVSSYTKLDEIPYDFVRKRLSIVVKWRGENLMITKGALSNVLEICTFVELGDSKIVKLDSVKEKIEEIYEKHSKKGFHVLGIAYKNVERVPVDKEDEKEMIFLGFLIFDDPPKPGISETIQNLNNLGIKLKILTGDSKIVAASLAERIGLPQRNILTGPELKKLSDEAPLKSVMDTDIFAEIEPNQKERIILALRKRGNVVGYIGDGINDAPALHAADVGISVDNATDIAKDAADIVLMEKDLDVLIEAVKEGRRTFANTLKYVFMATSANFGNMFSMAGISLLIPFLPLLPKQILLTNLLTDLPEMTIATDNVDDELVKYPHRWDIKLIRKFMVIFGPLSSVFDYLTFGLLLLIYHANAVLFRTGWFIESVVSASMVVLVVRSRRSLFKSEPGKYLLLATLSVGAFTFLFPFTPLAKIFGFAPLPIHLFLAILLVVTLYIVTAEIAKKVFYKKVNF
jgi:Mg2+-importing ATPase